MSKISYLIEQQRDLLSIEFGAYQSTDQRLNYLATDASHNIRCRIYSQGKFWQNEVTNFTHVLGNEVT